MEERNFTFLSDAFTAIASSERKDPILLSVEQWNFFINLIYICIVIIIYYLTSVDFLFINMYIL